jgi:uncharacterized protein (DUF934 family)
MSERRIIRLVEGRARIEEDRWTLFEDGATWNGEAFALIPLATALAQPVRLRAAAPVGIWLGPADEPEQAVPLFGAIDLVAVQFPKFGDGRGYSIGRLLRERYGYKGELRAVGQITRDHLFFLESCGFDAFELRDGQDPHAALAAFADFSEAYQASPARPQPLFRRRPKNGDSHH